MRLGQILKDYMYMHHISTRELAKELGTMSHTTIHRFINGKQITLKDFNRIWNWLMEEV